MLREILRYVDRFGRPTSETTVRTMFPFADYDLAEPIMVPLPAALVRDMRERADECDEPTSMEEATIARLGRSMGGEHDGHCTCNDCMDEFMRRQRDAVGYCEFCPARGGPCIVCGGGPLIEA